MVRPASFQVYRCNSNDISLRVASIVAALVLAAHAAWAAEPFKIRDIQIEGLQRVEPGTVFASMPLRVGDTYSDEKGTASIRALFALGLFTDVRLEINGDVLVVVVEERPSVASVEFVGTREFDKDVLTKALRDIGLAEGRPFDKALLDRAEQELKRQYINRSLYAAEVVTTVTPVERNRVSLTFTVNEGEPAKISEIRIVGNKVYSESTLAQSVRSGYRQLDELVHQVRPLLAGQAQCRPGNAASYYLARGYLEFRVDSTQVAMSPNKQDMSITINVTEGERFVVAGVRLAGNYLGRDDEFKSLISIRPGEAYNADQVAETVKAFTEHFGRFGYAFARVQPVPDIDRSTNRVTVVLQADPSRRAYVRRINVAGNNRTRDEVIRREFRQFEASWYDGDKIKLSRNRVDRLGYFSEVTMETNEVPGTADQVDLTMHVKERPTGSLTLGAGFSSNEGLGLMFGVNQQNAFGTGNSLGVQVNTSKINRVIVLNTTDPYFTQDGVSRTFDVYQRVSRPYLDTDSYALETTGTSVRFGIPFTERDTVYVGRRCRAHHPGPGQLPADGVPDLCRPVRLLQRRCAADDRLGPGQPRQRTGADQRQFPARHGRMEHRWRGPVRPRHLQLPALCAADQAVHFRLQWRPGLGQGLDGRPYPLFKNFYGGGLGSVRGFQAGSLGPRDAATGPDLWRSEEDQFQLRDAGAFPGGRQRPDLAPVCLCRCRQCLWTGRSHRHVQFPRRSRYRLELDFAHGPAAAGLGESHPHL